MRVTPQRLPEVLLVEPAIFRDTRGYFLETFNASRYQEAGLPGEFLQDNASLSRRGVVRGLHYQHPHGQGKLVMVLAGEILDVAVDIRRGSPTFGKWVSVRLDAATHQQLYIPAGFAHGFCVISESAVAAYKCTTLYHPASEGTVLFSDPVLGIDWPVNDPIVSDKDRAAQRLCDIPPDRLPV